MDTSNISRRRDTTVAAVGVTVYVYDAHDVVRRGLRRLVDEAPGLLVVGSSGNESQAWADIVRLRPVVAVIGGCLADDQGLALCRRVRVAAPSVACVVAPTAIEEPFGSPAAAAAGAEAFLVKRLHGFGLIETIMDIAGGGHPLARTLSRCKRR